MIMNNLSSFAALSFRLAILFWKLSKTKKKAKLIESNALSLRLQHSMCTQQHKLVALYRLDWYWRKGIDQIESRVIESRALINLTAPSRWPLRLCATSYAHRHRSLNISAKTLKKKKQERSVHYTGPATRVHRFLYCTLRFLHPFPGFVRSLYLISRLLHRTECQTSTTPLRQL